MSSNTPNLGLLKKDPMVDGNETFNIETMLNENWDKIDEAVGQVRDELGNIDVDIPEASLTEKGIVQLSSATNGTRENVAATEKAVKAAYDEALAGKQLGVEQKANVVAALNSIGVAASTSETWAQLVAKMAGVIKATGNATAGDVLAGKTFSNGSGNGVTGTMPNLTGVRDATGVAKWGDGALAVYPEKGYQKGGAGDGEIKVTTSQLIRAETKLSPDNLPKDVSVFGVIGVLERMTTAEKKSIADAITGKGVVASISDSNMALATKISQINTELKVFSGMLNSSTRTISSIPFIPKILLLYGSRHSNDSPWTGYNFATATGYILAYNNGNNVVVGSNLLSRLTYASGTWEQYTINFREAITFGPDFITFDFTSSFNSTSYIVFG
ncbi:phage tail protein [Priestia sp. BR_2]